MGVSNMYTISPLGTPERMTLCPRRNLEGTVPEKMWTSTDRRDIPLASPRSILLTRSLIVRRPDLVFPVLRTTPTSTTVSREKWTDSSNNNHSTLRQTYHNPAQALPFFPPRQQSPQSSWHWLFAPSLWQLGVLTRNWSSFLSTALSCCKRWSHVCWHKLMRINQTFSWVLIAERSPSLASACLRPCCGWCGEKR